MSFEVVKRLVEELYGHEQALDWNKIKKLVDSCIQTRKEFPSSSQLNHKDHLMIAYGDHVKDGDKPKLQAMSQMLKETGLDDFFTYIHLLPFFPYSSDDGFSVIDYYKVDEVVGTWSDIRELQQKHKIAFDFALNHSSQHCEWFKGFISGHPDYQDFYKTGDPNDDLKPVVRPRTHPLLTQYDDKYVWTTFSDDQVDLNYEYPAVLEKMIEVFIYYLSKGAQIIRMDAVAFLWKKPGSSSLHLPETHLIVKIFKAIAETIDPHVLVLTETNVPHEENISYFGDGDQKEADMVYQFSLPPLALFALWKSDTDVFLEWARSLETMPAEYLFLNFTASHDGVGVRPLQGLVSEADEKGFFDRISTDLLMGYKTNPDGSQSPYEINATLFSVLSAITDDAQKAEQAFFLVQSLALALKGLPAVYLSSLFAASDDIEGFRESQIKRRVNREKFELETLLDSVRDSKTRAYRAIDFYRSILSERVKHADFSPFAPQKVESLDSRILKVSRGQDMAVECYFNFSESEFSLNEKSGEHLFSTSGSNLHMVQPYGVVWLKKS